MTIRILALFFLGLLTASFAYADEQYDALFQRSLQAVNFNFDRDWAYTETTVSDGHVWVGRYDPRKPPGDRWTLRSVDGRSPSADEIDEFLDDRAEDDEDESEAEQLVEKDTIRLVEETDSYWLLGFTPDENEADFLENVDATIRISKPDGFLEYIDVHNNGTIRPAFGVKISKLITRFTFGPAAENGPVVPLSSQVEVTGSAFVFISFDEKELSRNSEFEYVGEAREMVPDE